MSQKPEYRLIRKNLQTNKWDNVGGAWVRDQGGFSVSIELERGGEKIKLLMVKNEERKKEADVQAPLPLTTAKQEDFDDSIPF